MGEKKTIKDEATMRKCQTAQMVRRGRHLVVFLGYLKRASRPPSSSSSSSSSNLLWRYRADGAR